MRQNLEGVPIPNCSEYITLHVYQFWCFYEKVNNSPKISVYAAALIWKLGNEINLDDLSYGTLFKH